MNGKHIKNNIVILLDAELTLKWYWHIVYGIQSKHLQQLRISFKTKIKMRKIFVNLTHTLFILYIHL